MILHIKYHDVSVQGGSRPIQWRGRHYLNVAKPSARLLIDNKTGGSGTIRVLQLAIRVDHSEEPRSPDGHPDLWVSMQTNSADHLYELYLRLVTRPVATIQAARE